MALDDRIQRETELVLPPGVFAFVLDNTKGEVRTYCGPTKQNVSVTDQMVIFDVKTGRFNPVNLQQAIQTNIKAAKGFYVVLENPSNNGKQPEPGKSEIMPIGALKMGQIENIPGPVSFPLWPGQVATVVRGHHLRTNQYLQVRVYDDEAAKAHWNQSVVKAQTQSDGTTDNADATLGINKDALVTGQLLVIKGTDVAFYIPPTGIEVLQDEDSKYVRDAVTLERLEYSILLDEDGNKEYVRGPAVVFPTPTQQFVIGRKDGKRKFKAFELQESNGIHVKVIADYEEEGTAYKAGDELFITGATQAIYFPRPEHSVIDYAGNEKYFAIAIPGGEGRYVLNRKTGSIDTVKGPDMFLPNPITQVIVKRILTDSECQLYYPGNSDVLEYNQALRGKVEQTDESEYSLDNASTNYGGRMRRALTTSSMVGAAASDSAGTGVFGDTFSRGTKYTAPRSILLDNRFEGAVRIDVWSGYAIQIVNSKGDRKTVIGPQTVLLEYDQYLERLSLSKGKPKNPDNRMNTGYLRYISNPVSDILNLKTADLVNVDVQVKYLVRFDEDQKDKWFSVDNYVQYMVDHLRSLIGNAVRNIGVQEFYQNAANILRDIVLGTKDTETGNRQLRQFSENGMEVYDLELISITVKDGEIATLLAKSRQETLTDSIELDRQKAKLMLVQGQESAKRSIAEELAATQFLRDKLDAEQSQRQSDLKLQQVEAENVAVLKRKEGEQAIQEITNAVRLTVLNVAKAEKDAEQVYENAKLDRKVKELVEEASASKTRMEAVQPALVEALVAMASTGQFEKIAEHLAPLSIVRGESLSGTVEQLFKGTPLEGMVDNLKSLSKVKAASARA